MKIKTSALTDLALEWAVAVCEGHNVAVLTVEEQKARWFEYVKPEKMEQERQDFAEHIEKTLRPIITILCEDGYKRRPTHDEALMLFNKGIPVFQYSTSWSQGGPIIEREEIGIKRNAPCSKGREWEASPSITAKGAGGKYGYGPTPLIAAMRGYVASKLGDEIEIPEELV